MGAADVVPGVSGGTMAFILGIYTRFIDAIRSFDLPWLAAVLRGDWRGALTRPHFGFLIPLARGILGAIGFFTRVVPLPRLLETHPEPVYGLFFGLVVGSVVVLVDDFGGLRARDLPALVVGLAVGLAIVTAVPTSTPETWWFVLIAGALAICAMVVPGISGSFVLLLLGKYAYILDAVGHLRLTVIVPFVAGIVLGLASFTRLLSWLLHRYERAALVGIAGFLLASLWVIWPFQARRYVEVRGKRRLLESQPVWPDGSDLVLFALVLAVAGCALVVILHRVRAAPHAEDEHEAAQHRDQRAVADAYIRGRAAAWLIGRAQGGRHELGRGGDDASAVIDNRRHAGIGGAQEVAAGFEGAHAGDFEVLMRCDRVTEPGIVADVDEQACRGQACADLAAERIFVADGDAGGVAGDVEMQHVGRRR